MTELSLLNSGSPLIMTSGEIAELTGKDKKHIHRDIKEQLFLGLYGKDGPNLDLLDIKGISVILADNGFWSEVQLDRYHTDILVSGYEVKYRAAIVKRWHELESQVRKPVSQMQMIAQMALAIDEQQQRQLALEAKQLEQEQSIKDIKASNNAVLLQSDYFSVMGYCNLMGIKVTLSQSSGYSRSLGTICKRLGIERQKVVDPRFGDVYIYSREVLHDFFVKKGLITI